MRSLIDIFESYDEWWYYKCCVDFRQDEVEDLTDMMDAGEEVTYDFLVHNVGKHVVQEVFSDYNWTKKPNEGLLMKDDYHVRYFQSVFRGNPCFYIVHSAIEYIFLNQHARNV